MRPQMMFALAAVLQIGCTDTIAVPDTREATIGAMSIVANTAEPSRAFNELTAIPDGEPMGVTMGPLGLPTTDQPLRGIVLSLSLSHPYAGDLHIELYYDSDNDGSIDAGTPIELYLARPGTAAADELWGCPVALDGTYVFKDEGWQAAGETASLAVFEQLPSGGSFYLTIVDDATGNSGVVRSWTISLASPAA